MDKLKQITNPIEVSQILYRKGEELKEKDYALEVYRMTLQKWENLLYKKEMKLIEQMNALKNKLLLDKSILYGEKRGRKKETGNKSET